MTEMTETTVRVERTYAAPAQAVFDAWTNPEVMRRWWHAGADWETPEADVDLREGGTLRVVMRRPDGREFGARGQYTVVDPPRRLAFAWTWDGDPGRRSLIEIEFAEHEGATTVVLTHSGLADEESSRSHRSGWDHVLDNLGRMLEH